ncbi:SRPBCC domain-containing protein [Streptomyces sp. NPDC006184]|uniref:SRPBCC domain-containing protein n=1 Tax=Streptomyces sp. NPDC006184 TaxID=3155455 RepID=UPI0033B2C5BF
MAYGSISREISIEATPEVVYDVISRPEHLREWCPDEAELATSTPGSTGTVRFGHGPQAEVEVLTVVEADPPRRVAFRWVADDGETAGPGNSLLVTFELVPAGNGALLRFTETGFRERGWQAATLEEAYQDHVQGWEHFLPRLVDYAARAATR